METSVILVFTIIIPLLGALLSFAWTRFAREAAILSQALLLVPVWICADRVLENGATLHEAGGWKAPLGIDLYLDGATALILAVSWLIGIGVSIYAAAYFSGRTQASHFWPFWMFLLAGLNALFLSRDIFNLYVTLEIVGIAAVALVALPGKREALVAAMRYLLVSLLGSLCYLLGVALLYAEYSTIDQALLAKLVTTSPTTSFAIAVMTGGLLLKAALFPLHFWLPQAHANAPAPVSAVLSALVVKGSLFILIRLWSQVFPEVVPALATQMIGALGAAAIVWGSCQAMVQSRLKMLIAYSTVAQLGYLFLVFPLLLTEDRPLAAWSGCFYFLASHACAKTAMFLAAGNVLHAAGHDEIRKLGGLSKVSPISMAAFAIAGVSIIGLPPSGGFLGKWLLLNAALGEGQWWYVAIIAIGGFLAACYVLRVVAAAFSDEGADPKAKRVPRAMEWSAIGMALVAILLGLISEIPIELIGIDAPVGEGPLLKGGSDS